MNPSSSPRQKYQSDVDELIESTPLSGVLTHYGLPQPPDHAKEYRMDCVFSDACADSKYGNLTVALDSVNRVYAHCCETRGNLLTLVHGLEKRTPPTGGRLRGQEFKDAIAKLREINAGVPPEAASGLHKEENGTVASTTESKPNVNTPLKRHDKEAARTLADLYEDLITDVAEMSPEAAQYVRERRWMTSELMQQWGVGWILGNGRSLFRNKYLVYTHRDERGEVVSYSDRNLSFEEKYAQWTRAGRTEGKKPAKHRYVSGFHRGAELYGGHATRMEDKYIRDSLEQHGIVVCEGQNDVIRMDSLQVAAVGLGSNKATDTQTEKIVRFARAAGDNRVLLLPDCDEEGEAGFQPLLWRLNEERVHVRLGISSTMFDGVFAGRQPENITDDEWRDIVPDF